MMKRIAMIVHIDCSFKNICLIMLQFKRDESELENNSFARQQTNQKYAKLLTSSRTANDQLLDCSSLGNDLCCEIKMPVDGFTKTIHVYAAGCRAVVSS